MTISFFHKSLLLSSLTISAAGIFTSSASILTPQARLDYESRLEAQPALKNLMTIPAGLTAPEEEAMKFLYAYMATPDIVDYPSGFYLDNVRLALKAQEEMPWGMKVPEREWRHFVLPVRVNNENLDDSRKVFYEELKDRVRNLSMADAILEVNHWCHEKVSYQPSDARTSSPLATVCNALGRCGEESTFTVAALRSVGIPARQVYTPRWAHTDDNHAWVEAWADGKWHFLGACEPEAVLDLAWFNAPAARGMLMTTKVTGDYDGPEEQLEKTSVATVINVTENYAPVLVSEVTVISEDGSPIENAEVRFGLYNYAEFYPLAIKTTGKDGKAAFKSGAGDMLVWVKDKEKFNFTKLSAGQNISITPDKDRNYSGSHDFDFCPPKGIAKLPAVSDAEADLNNRRKQSEDSIRLAYVATFISPDNAAQFSRQLGYGTSAADILVKSRGNHSVISGFLESVPDSLRSRAISLLREVSEKDLHDISAEVLADNLYHTQGNPESPLYAKYVLNPRIENEMLHPFKKELTALISPDKKNDYIANPMLIADYLVQCLEIENRYNPERYRQSACATMRQGVTDSFNRNIAFVAVCRSLGIPARIDPVSGATQYADEGNNWHDVRFEKSDDPMLAAEKGRFKILDQNTATGREPKYYSQFTISSLKNGYPRLMEFDDFESVDSINSRNEQLDAGQYMLVSGQRLADGSVLAHTEIFSVSGNKTAEIPLLVRQDTTALQVIGNLDAELTYTPLLREGNRFTIQAPRSILSSTGRGYYALGIIAPGHEPSAHALNDLSAAANEVSVADRPVLLLFPDKESSGRFRPEDYGNLPPNVLFGIDEGKIIPALKEGLELQEIQSNDFPLFIIADSFNRIVFLRKGYSINLGEKLATILQEVSK